MKNVNMPLPQSISWKLLLSVWVLVLCLVFGYLIGTDNFRWKHVKYSWVTLVYKLSIIKEVYNPFICWYLDLKFLNTLTVPSSVNTCIPIRLQCLHLSSLDTFTIASAVNTFTLIPLQYLQLSSMFWGEVGHHPSLGEWSVVPEIPDSEANGQNMSGWSRSSQYQGEDLSMKHRDQVNLQRNKYQHQLLILNMSVKFEQFACHWSYF